MVDEAPTSSDGSDGQSTGSNGSTRINDLVRSYVLSDIYRNGWSGAVGLTDEDQKKLAHLLLSRLPNQFIGDLIGIIERDESLPQSSNSQSSILHNFSKIDAKNTVLMLVTNLDGDIPAASSIIKKLDPSNNSFSYSFDKSSTGTQTSTTTPIRIKNYVLGQHTNNNGVKVNRGLNVIRNGHSSGSSFKNGFGTTCSFDGRRKRYVMANKSQRNGEVSSCIPACLPSSTLPHIEPHVRGLRQSLSSPRSVVQKISDTTNASVSKIGARDSTAIDLATLIRKATSSSDYDNSIEVLNISNKLLQEISHKRTTSPKLQNLSSGQKSNRIQPIYPGFNLDSPTLKKRKLSICEDPTCDTNPLMIVTPNLIQKPQTELSDDEKLLAPMSQSSLGLEIMKILPILENNT